MLKKELDTPSLILDLEVFERNLVLMRDFAAAAGKKLRPHAKTHKCPEIAKRQLAAGNCAGVCAAKLSEAEGQSAAGGLADSGHAISAASAFQLMKSGLCTGSPVSGR